MNNFFISFIEDSLHSSICGNKCGHNKDNPRLELRPPTPKGLGGVPRIITLAQERIEDYFSSPNLFPMLNFHGRQTRSERREAVVLLTKCLLSFMDLVTLCCGKHSPKGFIDISMNDIAKRSGLGKRRCERAMSHLIRSGFVSTSQPRTQAADGSFLGLRSIRVFQVKFFQFLKLDRILTQERMKATQRLMKKAKMLKARVSDFVSRKKRQMFRAKETGGRAGLRKKWNAVCAQVMTEHPHSSPEQWLSLTNNILGLDGKFRP